MSTTTPTRDERAVLIVGHGTIQQPADAAEFLLRIRRGRPASAALVEEVQRRYRLIGGSPLLSVTESLGRALQDRLGVAVAVAMRFWDPLVADVLGALVASGVRRVCILPVAPFSVHVYASVVREAADALRQAGGPELELVPVAPSGDDPDFVSAQASTVAPLLEGKVRGDTELVLTAHSLPTVVLRGGDPYQELFERSARAIEGALGWSARIAYQSQGADGGDWLGPSLDAELVRARAEGKREVVVAPVGFLADHVETLYDLDVEAAGRARDLGLGFSRARALGDDPALVSALAHVVRRAGFG